MHLDTPAILALIGGAHVAFLAIVFLFAPQKGLALTKHRAENLATIMAGRYFVMAALVIWAALYADGRLLAGIFVGLAVMAFFDMATYLHARANPWPHLAAGILSLVVAASALWLRHGA